MYQLIIEQEPYGNRVELSIPTQKQLIAMITALMPYLKAEGQLIIPITPEEEKKEDEEAELPWDMAGYDVDAYSDGDCAPAEDAEGSEE